MLDAFDKYMHAYALLLRAGLEPEEASRIAREATATAV